MLVANLVHQQSTSTGDGDFTLVAVNGKQTFDNAFSHGTTTDVFPYFISNQAAAEYEWGTGHMSDASTLVRDTVLGGSNGTSAVDFSAGTKDISNDIFAEEQIGSGYSGTSTAPTRKGFFLDDDPSTQIHRFRDRVFFGDAVEYTGNRAAPYGGDWSVEQAASYFIKNSQVAVLSSEGRIGLLVGSYSPAGSGSLVNGGIFAISVNESESGTGRAGYFEAFHKGNATATTGIEIQGGNYSDNDYVANAYSITGGYIGLSISVESGYGYQVGDDNDDITPPTKTGTCAIDIGGGSEGEDYQKWNTGIVFRQGALVRDGNSRSVAMSLATGHQIAWYKSATEIGAIIRSDATDDDADVGLIFGDNIAYFAQHNGRQIAAFQAVGDAINHFSLLARVTGQAPTLAAIGDDTNIDSAYRTKGSGSHRFFTNAGNDSGFVVTAEANAVNYLTALGAAAGRPAQLQASGSDTNIDIKLAPTGTGVVRFGTFSSSADVAVTGYITIKDSGGATRKLATIA